MKFPGPTLIAVTLLLLVPSLLQAQRPLFVFDNGLTDIIGHDAKAALVAELGYQGVGWRPGDTTGMLAALDKHGVKMAATYVALKPSAGTVPVSDAVIREIDALKGQDTIVWLGILGPKNSLTDEAALKAIHQVADVAERNNLKVALYPHTGFYTDTAPECLRLARLANRKNVGVSFNLCHFLLQTDSSKLESEIREIAPLLYLVSLNGANDARKTPVLPLGEGSFDTRRLLRVLDEVDYKGLVGLQCFQVKAPARDHLTKSMEAWKEFHRPGGEPKSPPSGETNSLLQ